MHIDILGIGGTFMVGVARLALALGHRVTGADTNLYPPMSDQLRDLGIPVREGYAPSGLSPAPDLVLIGNALTRGNPSVEYILDQRLPYSSAPAWLYQAVLREREVIAIAGTHGKTTVSSLLSWMLDACGQECGFLIGGVVENFGLTARLGSARTFVIEADEYDTAFFDKRSKFVHYAPSILVVNNLEFDHADIFPDLAAIQRQFHHLIRCLPRRALILRPYNCPAVDELLAQGVWSAVETFGRDDGCTWRHSELHDGTFSITTPAGQVLRVVTSLLGEHNVANATVAAAAAVRAGCMPAAAIAAVTSFANVKRRLEWRGTVRGVAVYDDFAHHPTAIAASIAALRPRVRGRLLAVTELRSNTMRLGVHRDTLGAALAAADRVMVLAPSSLNWDVGHALSALPNVGLFADTTALVTAVVATAQPDDVVLVMSNGGFDNVHERLLAALA
jgi:UDP-N-acetylmuramate: L-alanyl-gamma-D-glutamyl-meso-diaminopimelate ligase